MTRLELINQIKVKKSCLCVGLDTDINKLPAFLLNEKDPIFEFNKLIIDATKDYAVAYKPNIAFYESLGPKGWLALEKTMDYIPKDIFTIADAKRGDIGNTSKMYAKTYFNYFDFDAVTVAPYMGIDSVSPFLDYNDKWVILLGLTSNEGSHDFQQQKLMSGEYLYERVISKAKEWGNSSQLMFVVGATQVGLMKDVRKIADDYFFLVPGVGAQGGDITSVMNAGMNNNVGLLINSSRDILYAAQDQSIVSLAKDKAQSLQSQMETILVNSGNLI